jgi:Carboxypeptidase regulatory-like domain
MRRSTVPITLWILSALLVAATMPVSSSAQVAAPAGPPPPRSGFGEVSPEPARNTQRAKADEAQPRDAAPASKSTAAIIGRVTSLETRGPLRRVVIRITSPALPSSRTVSTNSDGRYEIRDLPPGEYSLTAERGGYLMLPYGQRRPGEPGKRLQLGEGQTARAIDFALPRVGVISGRVVDETGEPIANVLMYAMQFRYFQGTRKLVPVGGNATGRGSFGHTDDTGQYSLMLPPGEFVVMGRIRETWPLESDPTQVFGYPPTFYPGVVAATEAQRVKVGVGQEAGSIDFALVPARTFRVSGTVLDAGGTAVADESVTLSQDVLGPEGGAVFPSTNTATTGPDGRFSITNVQAGEYALTVRRAAANNQPAQEARQMLQVAGGDIDGLVIVTGGGGTVRGQVASDDGTPVPGVDRLTVSARPLNRLWSTVGRVNADGTFELKGVIGSVVLSIWTLTGDWTLKTVEQNGRNLADAPIDVRHGETLNGVRVVLTNRPTHIRGGLRDEKQQPAEGTVVIFPEDTSRWREDSRTVRAARPDQKGEFSIKGLPPGKYLIAALDYVQDGQWYDPEFLAELRPRAERLSLAEAENKRIDLTVRK